MLENNIVLVSEMESNKENVRHGIKTDKNYTPYESIKSYQKYYRATYGVFPKRRRLVAIPKCAAFGLNDLPILVRLAAVGMLCGLVGASVPHWAYIFMEPNFYATFGLWHYCNYEHSHCELIHDNIRPGHDIPAWFVLMQYNFVIGVAMSLIVLAGLTHNMNISREIRMGPNMYMCMECVGAIAALQKFVSLYVFVAYFEQFIFLHDDEAETDYHGAFYCAVISFCCDLIITIVLFLEEEIGPRPTPKSSILLDAVNDCENSQYTDYSIVNNGTDKYINLTSEEKYNLTSKHTAKVHQS